MELKEFTAQEHLEAIRQLARRVAKRLSLEPLSQALAIEPFDAGNVCSALNYCLDDTELSQHLGALRIYLFRSTYAEPKEALDKIQQLCYASFEHDQELRAILDAFWIVRTG